MSALSNDDIRKGSRALDDLIMRLQPGVHAGRFLTSSEIIGLMDELRGIRADVRAVENETSKLRWNEAARREKRDSLRDAAMTEVLAGGKVVAFPKVARGHATRQTRTDEAR